MGFISWSLDLSMPRSATYSTLTRTEYYTKTIAETVIASSSPSAFQQIPDLQHPRMILIPPLPLPRKRPNQLTFPKLFPSHCDLNPASSLRSARLALPPFRFHPPGSSRSFSRIHPFWVNKTRARVYEWKKGETKEANMPKRRKKRRKNSNSKHPKHPISKGWIPNKPKHPQ